MRTTLVIAAVTAALAIPTTAIAGPSAAPTVYKNCTNLNKRYPHGVGRAAARDRTSDVPVTNFRRSTKLYNEALSFNRGLDRDKDGIACETD